MKKILFALVTLWSLTCCENPIRMETKVHEDGSLDKTIVLEETDKHRETSNMFGINQASGWVVKVDTVEKENNDNKYKIEFKKTFVSAEAANSELNKNLDTLFGINTTFEKKFRWFYTYIRYSETFRPIDRFKKINPEDYFNLEDKAFLNRLPGEGTAISKADSLFLEQLNEKIYDKYADDALFNEFYQILRDVIQQNTTDKKWLDTLARSKDFIYKKLDDWDGDPQFATKIADSLGIPLPKEKAVTDFSQLSKDINSRVSFMSFARDARYTNIIEMPWTVINSNADSVAGNRLYYRPLPTKFAIQEYTMFAESRQLNIWAVLVSIGIALFTGWVLIKSRAKN
jgi:hypothetical protein